MKKVLVLAELRDGIIRNVTFEAIAAARTIEKDGEIIVVILGHSNLGEAANACVEMGANKIIIVENPQLKHYTADSYSQVLLPIVNDEKPSTIVMGHTAIGKDLSPKIANRLNIGLISDITHISEDQNQFVFTRPIYSGKAFERQISNSDITFITIRPNNITPLSKDQTNTAIITKQSPPIKDVRTVIKEVLKKNSKGIDMSEAKVIVAGGRGVKSASGFQPLQELADVLGGAVGASRAACDAEYCDYSLQIGQTGKVVTPDLYIACGISGAIQHLAGMSNSKVIIAINKDRDANIFKIADYGIVGDLFEILPLLTEEIRKIKAESPA